MYNQEKFKEAANKCFNDIVKRDLSAEELEFAINMANEHNLTDDKMYNRVAVDGASKIGIRSSTWFNYILTTTYKQFNLRKNGSNNT